MNSNVWWNLQSWKKKWHKVDDMIISHNNFGLVLLLDLANDLNWRIVNFKWAGTGSMISIELMIKFNLHLLSFKCLCLLCKCWLIWVDCIDMIFDRTSYLGYLNHLLSELLTEQQSDLAFCDSVLENRNRTLVFLCTDLFRVEDRLDLLSAISWATVQLRT